MDYLIFLFNIWSMYSHICFRVRCYTSHPEMVRITGNIPELGSWNVSKAFPLITDEYIYPTWYNEH